MSEREGKADHLRDLFQEYLLCKHYTMLKTSNPLHIKQSYFLFCLFVYFLEGLLLTSREEAYFKWPLNHFKYIFGFKTLFHKKMLRVRQTKSYIPA